MSDTQEVPDGGPANHVEPRVSGTSAIKLHVTLVLGLALCAAAFWFELGRAEGGNELSWAYVFEWPLLGLFAVYMWWRFLHPGFTIRRVRERPAIAPEYQGMLQAWQGELRKLERDRGNEEGDSAASSGDGVARDDE